MVTKATTTKKKAPRRNIGEIIQRGRIWYIRYYDGRGRRRLESTHSTDRDDAERLLRKRLSAKDAGVLPEAATGKLTLKDATDDLLNDYKVNGRRSLPEVRRKVELHLLPYFGERRRMTSITTAEMRAFVAERQREDRTDDGTITKRAASNAEINRELAALRRAFRLAVRAGRLVQCPHVPMLQERNTRRGFLEPDQITAICAALPEDVRPIVNFAYATGWRTASEVLPLEWRNIDWGGRCVRLDAHTTKNGEARSVPVHGRHRNDPEGPACRAGTAEGGWQDLPVRFPPQGRTDHDLPHGMEERLQGHWLPSPRSGSDSTWEDPVPN